MTTATTNTYRYFQAPLDFFVEAHRLGDVVHLPMALSRDPIYMINSLDAITTVLNTPALYTKDTRGQELLRVVLGVGLLTSEGKTWKERRRTAQPAFRRPKLSVYAGQMQAVVSQARERMTGRIDLGAEMMKLTLDIATVTLFSDRFEHEADTVERAMHQLLAAYSKLLANPLPSPARLPTPAARAYRNAIRELNRVVDGLIQRRRELKTDGDDLMHLWIHSGLDDAAVRDEVITMLLAAHETTANTLTYTLALLSRNPAARRTLLAELDALEARSPSGKDAPYLEATLKESLRMLPPAWITARAPSEDTVLEGVFLPKGALCLVPIHALQNDPRTWDNPQGFDPERWIGRTPSGVWMPFGGGQRKCIGSHFAMLEMRTALTVLLKDLQFDLLPDVHLRFDPSVTLRPAEPIYVDVKERSHG